MELWHWIQHWAFNLANRYHVNPFIFAAIYVGAIPFFFASLGWLITRIRKRKSIVIPLLATGIFFVSAYLYLLISGKNIPVWVYILIALLVVYGIGSTLYTINKKIHPPEK